MKRTITLNKTQISLSLNLVGNICDNASTQLNKIYDKGLIKHLIWKCYIYLKGNSPLLIHKEKILEIHL